MFRGRRGGWRDGEALQGICDAGGTPGGSQKDHSHPRREFYRVTAETLFGGLRHAQFGDAPTRESGRRASTITTSDAVTKGC